MTWRHTIAFAAYYGLLCAVCGYLGGRAAVLLGVAGWWQ